MRGWKVTLEEDLAQVKVGKTRGKALEVRPCGIGEGERSPLRVLLVEEFPESWSDEHEQALVETLQETYSGDWVIMGTTALHPRWEQLTSGEQRRLLNREGFFDVASWLADS